jgi:hypothetical protein
VKLYLLGYQDILAGHLYSNSKRKAKCKTLKSSGSKPSGGRDVAELGSVVVRRASRLFCALSIFLDVVCLFFSPTLVFSYLACTTWWRQKHIQKIYAKIAQLVEYLFIKRESTLLNNSKAN